MKTFVVGFIFDANQAHVVLETKTHPEWQKGRLNGIGGKIEDGESSAAAMVREAKEEAGLTTDPGAWRHYLTMRRPDLTVDFYAYVHPGAPEDVHSVTDEEVRWYDVKAIPQNALSNIHWMVPLALDALNDPKLDVAEVRYSRNND